MERQELIEGEGEGEGEGESDATLIGSSLMQEIPYLN